MNLLLFLLFFVYLVYPHELGHYLAARLAGVPGERLRIRMFTFPQHVASRGHDRWVGPREHELYKQLCWDYLSTRANVIRYVAAGLVVGSVFLILGCLLLKASSRSDLARRLVLFSIVFNSLYFAFEMALYLFKRRIFGDFSGLLALSRPAFVTVTGSVVLAHLLALHLARA